MRWVGNKIIEVGGGIIVKMPKALFIESGHRETSGSPTGIQLEYRIFDGECPERLSEESVRARFAIEAMDYLAPSWRRIIRFDKGECAAR